MTIFSMSCFPDNFHTKPVTLQVVTNMLHANLSYVLYGSGSKSELIFI